MSYRKTCALQPPIISCHERVRVKWASLKACGKRFNEKYIVFWGGLISEDRSGKSIVEKQKR